MENLKTKENRFRLIKLDDQNVSACENLFFDAFRGAPFNYEWLTMEKTRRYCRDLLNTPNFVGFLLESGGYAQAGCLGCLSDWFNTKTYKIDEFFVAPSLQRTGIGGLLLREVELVMSTIGVESIMLFTSRDIPAFNFYKKNGYITSSETVCMSKKITPV